MGLKWKSICGNLPTLRTRCHGLATLGTELGTTKDQTKCRSSRDVGRVAVWGCAGGLVVFDPVSHIKAS